MLVRMRISPHRLWVYSSKAEQCLQEGKKQGQISCLSSALPQGIKFGQSKKDSLQIQDQRHPAVVVQGNLNYATLLDRISKSATMILFTDGH